MKLKYNFVINEIAGQKVAVPIDCGHGEQSIIKTNDTGEYIINLLKNDITKEEIIAKINADFEINSQDELSHWLDTFIEKLKTAEVLCDD
ncbi:MAG: hypothetical protein IKT44_03585 [Clostridia bacterium]|nr:hypothetical protein [Clostridia bacterium]